MARANDPKVVGSFVIGALALLIVAVAVFGGGQLFTRTRTAVAFFDGSVAGLSVGAPVTFRGVPVGTVSRIVLEVSAKTGHAEIPVYLQFKPETIAYSGGDFLTPDVFKEMIARGFRAQLVSQSLITGQVAVQLNYFPGAPLRLVSKDTSVPEIPTIPSEIQELKSALSSLPLQSIAESALGSLKSLNDILKSPDTMKAVKDLAATLEESQRLVAALSPELQKTLANINGLTDQANTTIKSLQPNADASLASLAEILNSARQQTGPLITDLRATARSFDTLARSAQSTLFAGSGVLATTSSTRRDAERTMRNLAEASASLRSFAAQIERNPNALILGRGR